MPFALGALGESSTRDSLTQRGGATKRSVYRACTESSETPVTYERSLVYRVIKGGRIDLGQVQGKFSRRIPPTWEAQGTSGLSHDEAGLVSVRTARDNPCKVLVIRNLVTF